MRSPSTLLLLCVCTAAFLFTLDVVVASRLSMQLGDARSMEDMAMLESLGGGPALFHDAANGEAYLRAPYLPATVNGPMYQRTGPQSHVAKEWLEQGAQPPWSALPFGPRTPSATYVLPWDHMREVQDEFSWNYDHKNPAAPPQFSFAAPIFLEESSQSESTTENDADADAQLEDQTEQEEEAEPVAFVQAIEVDNLAEALTESSSSSDDESSLIESESTTQGGPQLIPDDFWSQRTVGPGFNSYTNPYHDLTHPTLVGSGQDYRWYNRGAGVGALQAWGQSGYYGLQRGGWRPHPSPHAYHQGKLPPFAHQIEPFKHMANLSPNVINVGENEEMQTFTSTNHPDAVSFVEQSDDCVGCVFN